ncbi:MAG: hypothetical protein ACRDRU_00015 [Pseudonocardiaceae bacterium]
MKLLSVVGFLRVPSSGVGDPHGAGRFLDQISDAPTPGDLKLPLFQVCSPASGGGETAAESMVPLM